MNRALDYAHRKGVTLVAALGNEHADLGKPRLDAPAPTTRSARPTPRPIDNDDLPDHADRGPATSST